MSGDESIGAPRRPPRQGVGSSPVGSTLSVVLAIIAVVAGFLILNTFADDDVTGGPTDPSGAGDSAGGSDDDASTPGDGSVDAATETSTTAAPSTTAPRTVEGATVVVANANTVPGSAGTMSKSLEAAGYAMGTPVNASGANRDESIVYYDATVAAAQDVADSVARDLGGIQVETIPVPPPTESGVLENGASVLLLLGDTQAGRSLEELSQTAADNVAAPEPSGDGASSTTAPAGDATETSPTAAAGDG